MNKHFGLILLALFLMQVPLAEARTQRYGEKICHSAGYQCVKVKRYETWERLFPDEYERDLVKRINRVNTRLYWGMIIAVPKNLSYSNLMTISPFARWIDTNGEKTIVIDLSKHAFAAYDRNGNLIHWGPASGGKSWCPDVRRSCRTVRGTFRMYTERGPNCFSMKFPLPNGGAPMPYCMFFHRGFAIHASTEVPGYHASHGCVRVFYDDAKWLNQQFINLPHRGAGRKGTKVIVKPYSGVSNLNDPYSDSEALYF